VFEALKLGIALGGPMQEGWLIPFGNTATLVVGYMGYRNIIDRAGSVVDMHPRAVHNGRKRRDGREWIEGTPDSSTTFSATARASSTVRATPRRCSASNCAPSTSSRTSAKAASRWKCSSSRKSRRTGSAAARRTTDPWQTDYVPMALKTGMRKITKYLPKSNELLARALDLDDRADRGVDQALEIPAGVTYVDADDAPTVRPPASPMERLKQTIGAAPATPPAGAQPATEAPKAEDIKW
jgi:recombinational DNA repair protein RecT